MNGGINDIATRKELSVEEHKQRALHILLEVASFCLTTLYLFDFFLLFLYGLIGFANYF